MLWNHHVLSGYKNDPLLFPLKYESRVCEADLVDLLALCLVRVRRWQFENVAQPGVGVHGRPHEYVKFYLPSF